jgi:flotillin
MLPKNKMHICFTLFQVKIQGQNEEMLLAACEQFLGKQESEIQHIALVTREGHQRAIRGSMTVEVSA